MDTDSLAKATDNTDKWFLREHFCMRQFENSI